MHAHRTTAIVSENGSLTIDKLPFAAGKPVEVVVYATTNRSPQAQRYPLRGLPLQYENPTETVADSDWEILR